MHSKETDGANDTSHLVSALKRRSLSRTSQKEKPESKDDDYGEGVSGLMGSAFKSAGLSREDYEFVIDMMKDEVQDEGKVAKKGKLRDDDTGSRKDNGGLTLRRAYARLYKSGG